MRLLLPTLSVAFALAAAQNQNITIDPSTVDPGLKSGWCGAQFNTCRMLCANSLTANNCNSETLEFDCRCSNGSAPGLQYYTQTIPTFICEQAYSDCITANTDSAQAQEECRTDIRAHCGTLDPTRVQSGGGGSSEESTSSAALGSGTQAPTAGSDSTPSTSSSTGAAAPTNAAYIGNGIAVVAAGVFAALL
ncbi:hypothetical protein MMYC01_202339 [Madurella mycetomatis]|uniref:DUF7707 domain-containing protein n=1 Tax=Madurella mycetomatis TaxID=100816 RepID=A0A175WFM6_9PEZI|nr:hypothetical protein MMYC01_202339 [Madurella mycetomatis]